jgi:tight adherence protein B
VEIALATFVGIAGLILGAYWLFVVWPETRDQSRLRRRLKSEDPIRTQVRVGVLKAQTALSHIGALNWLLSRFTGLSVPMQRAVEEAGLPLTVGTFVLGCIAAFVVAAFAAQHYTHLWWMALIAGIGGACVPVWMLSMAKARRLQRFEEQFPEAIELIARAMRAGHGFATGIKMASDELPAPAGPEFRLLYERQNYGAQLPDALKAFAQRIPLLDARFFVTAVLTQRETGGNLSEVLDRLAAVMRERFKIRREVRVRSAHGRVTAYVLAGMPPTLAAIMFLTNPGQIQIMFTDPLGIRMIVVGIVLQLIGVLLVRKIVDIQY